MREKPNRNECREKLVPDSDGGLSCPNCGWRVGPGSPKYLTPKPTTLEIKDAEITSLRSQLGEARRKAIEECAQIATAFAEVTAKLDGGLKSTTAAGMFNIAKSIRALLTESKT